MDTEVKGKYCSAGCRCAVCSPPSPNPLPTDIPMYRPSADETRESMIRSHPWCPTLDEALGCSMCQARSALESAEAQRGLRPMADPASKPTNPKDAIGSSKLPMHLWPETASMMGSLALLDGALKYGRSNYREIGVRASIYYDAARRHLAAWMEGEDHDPDSGVPHLGHALACIAIIVDAQAAGKLNDDRNVAGGYRALVTELTPHVARLQKQHAERKPKHYTIADSEPR